MSVKGAYRHSGKLRKSCVAYPKPLLKRIRTAIAGLADDPRPNGHRKLVGVEDLYRIRVGDWRIVYAIEDEILLILVVEVSPRGDAYRNL